MKRLMMTLRPDIYKAMTTEAREPSSDTERARVALHGGIFVTSDSMLVGINHEQVEPIRVGPVP